MDKDGKFLLRLIIYIAVAGAFLIYGFSIGRYEVFPFKLLKSLTESKEEVLKKSDNFIYTAMQRLHVNKMYLPEDQTSGGSMTTVGTNVLIVNRVGELIAFDFENFEKIDVAVPDIYLGLDLLKADGWLDREDFEHTKVRVKGTYAEMKGEDEIKLFVSHHFYNGECFRSKLSQISLYKSGNKIVTQNNWEEIYNSIPCLYPDDDIIKTDTGHNRWVFGGHISGGKIIRYDDNHLLLSEGDHFYDGYDKEAYAQDEDKSYGKFILINTKTYELSNFAIGSRNAQGIYKDANGTLWSTEHGPAGGDELNIIREDQNYGWPEVTYGIHYSNEAWPLSDNQGRHNQFTKPIYSWVGSIAPSELIRIEGEKFRLWKGDLLVTSLKDRSIHRLRPDSDNSRIVYDEVIELGHRIRNIVQLHDESLLLRTDDNYLVHIDDAGPIFEEFNMDTFLKNNEIARGFTKLKNSAENNDVTDNSKAALIFERSCSMCHSLGGSSMIGPSLNYLANRQVGSLEDFNYSNTLKSSNEVWDEKLLKQYLNSPQNTFSGTSMERVKLSNREIELLTKFLMEN
ncbi:hypothetical protein G3570_08480 [Balneolaceae bacterium YR4-1]|uniref:Cytochrome c domain-containing protein n=1 Tax=Halalkalibaculum roseum TaxID=2709311 RepID=A0A6M1SXG2_9BACT|nr:PQQ-dependent sugar dehydrogenase [Halalkalibaculum roseum]NGP76666.1 hypothetical protein [Halalkalibaculum roseum]